LTIYIEGDGLAWINKSTISTNPTPINPIALKLALQHPNNAVAYLARPCQYSATNQHNQCETKFWSNARFSPAIINAMNEAVSNLKKAFNAQQIQLVGFSGGAAIAALITAKRNDVIKLITVAGNLDHHAWSNYHKVSPLTESVNAADFIEKLRYINQIHFVGSDDKVIPPFLIQDFVKNYSENKHTKVIELPNYTHTCCWDNNWKNLLNMAN
jgi:dienelactone hydrolase